MLILTEASGDQANSLAYNVASILLPPSYLYRLQYTMLNNAWLETTRLPAGVEIGVTVSLQWYDGTYGEEGTIC